MDMTTTATPKKGVLSSSDFDWGDAAGPMQGATSWTPSENAQASSQLAKILQSDSPLMVAARSGAERAAARRGLLASSISAGAGQEAMVNTATPIATQDANTWAQSQRDGAQAANDFARDANAFGRQKAMTQYQGILARESQDSDQRFRAGESALDRDFTWRRDEAGRAYGTSERLGSQEFQAGQSALDRGFTLQRDEAGRAFTTSERQASQDFASGQSQKDRDLMLQRDQAQRDFAASQSTADRQLQADLQAGRISADAVQNELNRDQQVRLQELQDQGLDRRQAEQIAAQERSQRESQIFQAGESQVARDASAAEAQLNRVHQEAMTRLSAKLQQDAQNVNIPQNLIGDMSARMSEAVRSILSDPNMDAAAKDAAVQNYYKYANTQMQWMASFYGVETPNFMGGDNFKPPSSSPAAPAPTPVANAIPPLVAAPAPTGALAAAAEQPASSIIGDGDPSDYAWQRWRQEA